MLLNHEAQKRTHERHIGNSVRENERIRHILKNVIHADFRFLYLLPIYRETEIKFLIFMSIRYYLRNALTEKLKFDLITEKNA